MKIIFFGFLIFFSTHIFAKRKISNTYYYYCTLERTAEIGSNFKDEFIFHLSPSQEETKISKSKRWNKTDITLKENYEIEIRIKENLNGFQNDITEILTPKGLSYSNPIAVDRELKLKLGDDEVNFRFRCE